MTWVLLLATSKSVAFSKLPVLPLQRGAGSPCPAHLALEDAASQEGKASSHSSLPATDFQRWLSVITA